MQCTDCRLANELLLHDRSPTTESPTLLRLNEAGQVRPVLDFGLPVASPVRNDCHRLVLLLPDHRGRVQGLLPVRCESLVSDPVPEHWLVPHLHLPLARLFGPLHQGKFIEFVIDHVCVSSYDL